MKNLIVTDFDGVLNPGAGGLQTKQVERLNELALSTGAEIVISSSWRTEFTIHELRTFLWDAGLSNVVSIVGVTPDLTKTTPGQLIVIAQTRWDEIKAYLYEHVPDIESFVILDDACTGNPPRDRLVETKGAGLTWQDVGRARDILETPCLLVDYLWH